MVKYKVLDLFAGAGGLSLGFQQAEGFQIVAAAENNENAKLTYQANHPGVKVMDDVRSIDYSALQKECGDIDVVIGGPPCQGFSNANRQKAQTISMNNSLVKEYVHAIRELQPQVFVMENVSTLRSEVHRFYYSAKDSCLIDKLSINLRKDELELLSEEFCPEDPDVLTNTLGAFEEYLWNEKDYLAINVLYRQRNNHPKLIKAAEKYKNRLKAFSKCLITGGDSALVVMHANFKMAIVIGEYLGQKADEDELLAAIEQPLMLQRMYRHYKELYENEIVVDGFTIKKGICAKVSSFPVFEYVQKVLSAQPYGYDIQPGILNAADFGAPQKRERYIVIGTKNGHKASLPEGTFTEEAYRTVRDAISDLEKVPTDYIVTAPPRKLDPIALQKGTLLAQLHDSDILHNHIVTETGETAMERFKALQPGQNFHSLDDELKSTYTNAKRTQNTIYLRLKYDEPSGTVVNVRKSMWVHPSLDRALSIREAARLQTFPDSFIFTGVKDSQYQQVGNAVPPMLAKAIAVQTLRLLVGEKDG